MIGLVVAVSSGGCPQQPLDSGREAPGTVAGPGFSVTLPSSAEPYDVGLEIPGATFQACYTDDLDYAYIIYTIDVGSLALFSGDENNDSVRFDGTGRTSSGDFLLLMTMPGQYGDYTAAWAELADGQFLLIGTDTLNPAKNIIFGSIELVDTDGTSIEENASEGVPLLAAPTKGGIVVLDDDSAYRVTESADLRQIAGWTVADSIMPHDAADFSFFSFAEPFFLTKIGEWESVSAEYIGVAERATITSVTDVEFGRAEVSLSNGCVWRAAYADENEAKTWNVGDEVALLEDSGSFLGYTLLRLTTGASIVVEPN